MKKPRRSAIREPEVAPVPGFPITDTDDQPRAEFVDTIRQALRSQFEEFAPRGAVESQLVLCGILQWLNQGCDIATAYDRAVRVPG